MVMGLLLLMPMVYMSPVQWVGGMAVAPGVLPTVGSWTKAALLRSVIWTIYRPFIIKVRLYFDPFTKKTCYKY